MNWLIVFFSLINLSVCIYEDQIGKFDWRQNYVGRIKFSQFDTVSTAKKIIVATEENVLAALHLKTGQVMWRHVFESTAAGNIQLLHVSDKVVTVTGSNPYLVRGWDTSTGILKWEWSMSVQNEERAEYSEWWVQDNMLVHLLPVFGSHVEVTLYNLLNGHNRGATSKLPAVWSNDGCIISPPYYACVSGPPGGRLLLAVDVTSQAVQVLSRPLTEFTSSAEGNLNNLDGNSILPGFVIDDSKVVLIQGGQFTPLKTTLGKLASAGIVDSAYGPVLLQVQAEEKGIKITAHTVATGEEVSDIGGFEPASNIPEPELLGAVCTRSARDTAACRILVNGADDGVHLVHQAGRIIWTREEALANVVAAEFVDLPVSDLDAAIESEFDQKEGSIWAAFSRRLQTQLQQLQALLASLQAGEGLLDDAPEPLVRDYFNLHKIIVLVTDVGKIFGMDNLSGAILWHRYEADLDTENVAVMTRRSARHPPHDAVLTVLGKHMSTGNGLILNLNPIRGTGLDVHNLDKRVLQYTTLSRADAEKLHALVLLDEEEIVQVLPPTAASLVQNVFVYVADKRSGRVQGYALRYDGQKAVAQKTWSAALGGSSPSGTRVISAARRVSARAQAAGRALPDRSVLYAYSNPNLVMFLTEGPDPTHKDIVTATCIDAVSGAVVAAHTHRRARAAPLALHEDNFFAYVYYNDKHRRAEIATLELYEGSARWLPAGTAFSSLSAPPAAPLSARAAYILPAAPVAAALTNTERSLTDRHLLLALSTGAIVELPWAYLEPRRPVAPTAEQREEGLIPYAPELPLPAEAVINYNQTLHRVRAIYTAPSGLESTSLVLATGLDLFYTRVAPSKTFDLLKDDFDYYLISIVLSALIIATYSTKYFASRKMLKMAWK